MKAAGHTAVMASRHEAIDSLDFFPTPPWATRALLKHVIPHAEGAVWEPACGAGHMADVLAEQFEVVRATDVHNYGYADEIGSFVGEGLDVIGADSVPEWIITNPPFNLAAEFAERAIATAKCGVALLVRTAWLEGKDRYERLFSKRRPSIRMTVALFSERVPMVKGRWDPSASTATSYAWVVWECRPWNHARDARLVWIPPGQRQALTRPTDIAEFAHRTEAAK